MQGNMRTQVILNEISVIWSEVIKTTKRKLGTFIHTFISKLKEKSQSLKSFIPS